MNRETLIFNLTTEQLRELIQDAVTTTIDKRLEERMPRVTEFGISGLARIIGSSRTYAQELKNKGVFNNSISQKGRKITIDIAMAQKEWNLYQNKD